MKRHLQHQSSRLIDQCTLICFNHHFLAHCLLTSKNSGGGGAQAPPAPPLATGLTWRNLSLMLLRDLIIEMKNSPMDSHHYQGGILRTTFRPVPLNCIRHFHNYQKIHRCCVFTKFFTKQKRNHLASTINMQVVYHERLDLFWACYNPQK